MKFPKNIQKMYIKVVNCMDLHACMGHKINMHVISQFKMTSLLQLLFLLTTAYSCAAQHIDQVLSTRGGDESSSPDALSSRSVLGNVIPALNYESGGQNIDPNSYEYKIINNKTRVQICGVETLENAYALFFKADYGSRVPGLRFFDSVLKSLKLFYSDSSRSRNDYSEGAVKKFGNLINFFFPEREVKIQKTKRVSLISHIFFDVFNRLKKRIGNALKDTSDDDPYKNFFKNLQLFGGPPPAVFNRSKESKANIFKRLAKIFLTLVESDGDRFRHDSVYLFSRDLALILMNIFDNELSPIIYRKNIMDFILRLTFGPMNPLLDQLLLKGQTVEEIHKEIRLHWLPLLQKAEQFISRVRNGNQEIPDSLRPLFQIATPCSLYIIQDALNLFLANYSGQLHADVGHVRLQGRSN